MKRIHEGQQVVCVENAFEHWKNYGFKVPVKHDIYTVREIKYYDEEHYKGFAIKLCEIVNPVYNFPNMTDEVSFRIQYFMPVEEYINSGLIDEINIEPLLKNIKITTYKRHRMK